MSNPPIAPAAPERAAERAAEDRRLRQDLDRIDELDETNPFGQAVHHGGPYEAVSRIVQKDVTSVLMNNISGTRCVKSKFTCRWITYQAVPQAIGTQNSIMSGDVCTLYNVLVPYVQL